MPRKASTLDELDSKSRNWPIGQARLVEQDCVDEMSLININSRI